MTELSRVEQRANDLMRVAVVAGCVLGVVAAIPTFIVASNAFSNCGFNSRGCEPSESMGVAFRFGRFCRAGVSGIHHRHYITDERFRTSSRASYSRTSTIPSPMMLDYHRTIFLPKHRFNRCLPNLKPMFVAWNGGWE